MIVVKAVDYPWYPLTPLHLSNLESVQNTPFNLFICLTRIPCLIPLGIIMRLKSSLKSRCQIANLICSLKVVDTRQFIPERRAVFLKTLAELCLCLGQELNLKETTPRREQASNGDPTESTNRGTTTGHWKDDD